MSQQEVASLFRHACICVRAYTPSTGTFTTPVSRWLPRLLCWDPLLSPFPVAAVQSRCCQRLSDTGLLDFISCSLYRVQIHELACIKSQEKTQLPINFFPPLVTLSALTPKDMGCVTCSKFLWDIPRIGVNVLFIHIL